MQLLIDLLRVAFSSLKTALESNRQLKWRDEQSEIRRRRSKTSILVDIGMLELILDDLDQTAKTEKVLDEICYLLESLINGIFPNEVHENHKRYPKLHMLQNRWNKYHQNETTHTEVDPIEILTSIDAFWELSSTVPSQLASQHILLCDIYEDDDVFYDTTELPSASQEALQRIREDFIRLHQAMTKVWRCSCRFHHVINLRLDSCHLHAPDRDSKANFFFYGGSSLHRWQEGLIYISEVSMHSTDGRKVRFVNENTNRVTSATRIGNLCHHVNARNYRDSCLEMRLDNGRFSHVATSCQTHDTLEPQSSMSLKELLERPGKFTRLGKYLLAVMLAQSILPLLDTPWLAALWTKEHIHFANQRCGRLSEPFLSTELRPDHPKEPQKNCIRHPWPELLSLGILLLEIELGAPIENFREDKDLEDGQSTADTNYTTAERLLYSRKEDIWDGWKQAIEACLYPDLSLYTGEGEFSSTRLNEMEWQTIYNTIVGPLMKDLENGFGTQLQQSLDPSVKTPSDFWRSSQLRCWVPLEVVLPRESPAGKTSMIDMGGQLTQRSSLVCRTKMRESQKQYSYSSSPADCIGYQLLGIGENDAVKARDTRTWLRKMQESFENHLKKRLDGPRVRIALLDSGFDPTDPFLRGCRERIVAHRSLVPDQGADEDLNGHGTHILASLLRHAPFADLYVYRVANTRGVGSAEDVGRAIEWATNEWNVDIISISFGFSHHKYIISEAITKAVARDVIIFAAASNGGGNDGRAYPAKDPRVMCIHSTDAKGNRSYFSPSAERNSDNFALPGEQIESSWPLLDGASERTKLQSGTSFATPSAAALAANILEYAEQKLTYMSDHKRKPIRGYVGIRAIFKLMVDHSVHSRDGYQYIIPWSLFGPEKPDDYICYQMNDALGKL